MAMQGYTKLFNSILASSIWSESDQTRIVWITILAMSDRNGNVGASLPGLAALARVSLKQCKQAVETLESPDKYSRTADFEGRRIEKIDGGWRILNYLKFRKLLSAEERREYLRVKQQEHRDRIKGSQQSSTERNQLSTDRNPVSTVSTHSDSDSDSEIKRREHPSPTKPVGEARGSPEFLQFWEAYPRKVDRQEAMRTWIKGLLDGSIAEILAGLAQWKQTEQWSDQDKIPYPSTWLNKRRWKENPLVKSQKGPSLDERRKELERRAGIS